MQTKYIIFAPSRRAASKYLRERRIEISDALIKTPRDKNIKVVSLKK